MGSEMCIRDREYQYDSEDFDIHGIELVKKVSKSMDYIRAIDMNNTIISF